jgi:hypothetical protein
VTAPEEFPVVDDPSTPEDEAALWEASVAERNRDGVRGGPAAPTGGPFEHDVVGDETREDIG